MANKVYWEGYIETIDGLERCEVRYDGEYVSVWIGGNLADDVESFIDLIGNYGSMFYGSREHYKNDITTPYADVWPIKESS